MPYLLNLGYLLLLALVSPLIVWSAWRHGKHRSGWAEKLLGLVPRRVGDARCLWFHAVSVGEVNLLAPLLTELRASHPDWDLVISTTTLTGHQLAKKKYADLPIFYCPLDFSWSVRAALRRIRPTGLVLAELELWPNLIRAARKSGARVAVVNGRLSQRSHAGYARIRPLVRGVLQQLDLIGVQTPEYAERFLQLGALPSAVQVTGSMKFDGARTDRDNPATQHFKQLAGLSSDHLVLLAGSTQEPEESIVLATYQSLAAEFPQLRLILVPRHPERFGTVARMLEQSGLAWQRRSQWSSPVADRAADWRVLLVDTIGELGAWWGLADVAFVGGSLGSRGGQNMIEPAAFGAAVCFGPNTRNFRDVVMALLAANAACVVADGAALTAFTRRCLVGPNYRQALGTQARQLALAQAGATTRTARLLMELFPTTTTHSTTTPARQAA